MSGQVTHISSPGRLQDFYYFIYRCQLFGHLEIQISSFRIYRIYLSKLNILSSGNQLIQEIIAQMNPQKTKKRQQYTRDEFSDKEVYNQIKDDIKQIRDKNLKQVQEDSLINKLYEDKKRQMKISRLQTTKDQKPKVVKDKGQHELGEDDEQEGQIKKQPEPIEEQLDQQGAPSINNLGDIIRPLIITRNKMAEIIKNRKYEEVIKGCFVRYKSQNSNAYILALIVGVVQGEKQYQFGGNKMRNVLHLQQQSTRTIKLSIDNISNQLPPGNLEISKWLQANRKKIPKEKDFQVKMEQLKKFLRGQKNVDKQFSQYVKKAHEGKFNQIDPLVDLDYYLRNEIHDLAVQNEETDGKQKAKIEQVNKKIKFYEQTLVKVQQRQEMLRAEKQKLSEVKKVKVKGYIEYILNDRKQDKIRNVYHKSLLDLYSNQNSAKLIGQLQEAHRQFAIDVDF